ncbi:MAG TPA: hypothetical protein VEY09_00265 [Pyrinomonadaceae bacterium]|nr:hypothetical protein [Pyrinomonadaceae bacterium]
MSEDVERGSHKSTPVVKSTSVMRRFVIYGGVLLFGFLLGFVPMWLQSRATAGRLADAERRLTLAGMQGNLASAAIDARRGDYEPARQATSQFFTSLRAEIDEGDTSDFTRAQRAGVQALLADRDEIITLLSRSDPASADRVSELYVAYRKAVGG